MRNYIKNDLLDLVQTMKELCGEILQECEWKHTRYLLELLEQGQQAAVSIGEIIEKFEDEGTEAVASLEFFCEHMYQMSKMAEADCISVSKENRFLNKLLLNIENGIRHLPVTYEIVFFPYKASMWDCMESIYLAAVKETDCHVSVVPIPYYDVISGGRFGQMHYEGSRFPEGIPITLWERYNVSECRPDIAYIHNPFDGCNLVTSVHPEYYSDKLKQCVSKLVYVPYGISREDVPDSHQHLPVHDNMDFMVVQSRRLERCYTNVAIKGKMLPLGSPKFDRVIACQKNGVQLPDEWNSTLDGRLKIFYNTSISSLLENTETALKKMEYVFRCFEGHSGASLVWRPHPLMESTLQSMRPQYLQWYRQLVQQFRQKRIGIFDQNADIDKTIVLCDAYAGEDTSSVLDLFYITGKPIFILDMKINRVLTEAEYCAPLFSNVVECDGRNWTFSYQFNALCTLDMETGKIHIVDSIPRYKWNQSGLVSSLYNYDGKLILAPNCMDSIAEYDVDTHKFSFIRLQNAFPWGNMASILFFGEDFIILPARYPAIIQYSRQKNKYIYHRQMFEDVRKRSEGKEFVDGRGYFGGGIIKNGCWYFPLLQTNAILVWHMGTFRYEIISIGNDADTYGAIADVNGGFLLQLYEGARLLFWNPKTGEEKEIKQFPKSFEYRLNTRGESHPFGGFWMAKNHLLLMPQLGNQILEIDRETLEISIYEMDWKDHIRELQEGIFDNQWGNISNIVFTDWDGFINQDYNEIALITSADGCMLKLNIDTHQYTEVQTGYDYAELKERFPIEELYEKSEIPVRSREDRYHTLTDFINAMTEGKIQKYNDQQLKVYSEFAANLDGTCGEKVHKAVKKSLQ